MPLLPNILMAFALMLALTTALLLRFSAVAFTLCKGIVGQNRLLKSGSLREIRRGASVPAALTDF